MQSVVPGSARSRGSEIGAAAAVADREPTLARVVEGAVERREPPRGEPVERRLDVHQVHLGAALGQVHRAIVRVRR